MSSVKTHAFSAVTQVLLTALTVQWICGCASSQIGERNRVLLQAAKDGDVATIQSMLDKYAQVETQDSNRDTPLLLAIKGNHLDAVALLLSRGAEVDRRDKYRETPLNLAIRHGSQAMVQTLVSNGADINARGALGNTPLHVSIYRGDSPSQDLLRKRGADTGLLNDFGLNPDEMRRLPALQGEVKEIARLLTPAGQWSDAASASRLYNSLKAQPAGQVLNALVFEMIASESLRLPSLLVAIKLGLEDSEERLLAVLDVYGDEAMAEDYLNCGSKVLADGAGAWAKKHGYRIFSGLGSHRATWGRF